MSASDKSPHLKSPVSPQSWNRHRCEQVRMCPQPDSSRRQLSSQQSTDDCEGLGGGAKTSFTFPISTPSLSPSQQAARRRVYKLLSRARSSAFPPHSKLAFCRQSGVNRLSAPPPAPPPSLVPRATRPRPLVCLAGGKNRPRLPAICCFGGAGPRPRSMRQRGVGVGLYSVAREQFEAAFSKPSWRIQAQFCRLARNNCLLLFFPASLY